MSKPLTLNLRTNDGQAALIPGFEGQSLQADPRKNRAGNVPIGLDLFNDRPTAVNCVPVLVELDDLQESFDL